VHDCKSAVHFARWCLAVIGLAYHPDTPFAEYVDRNGQAAFSAAECARLEELAERAFEHCDPYAIGCEEFQRLLGADDCGPQIV
jgi:hypothetical protein